MNQAALNQAALGQAHPSPAGPQLARGRRWKQALLFVTIVWTVAASFVVFEELFLFGAGLVARDPGLSHLSLSKAVQSSTSCDVSPAGSGSRSQPSAADVHAWRLGLTLGRDALYRQRLEGPAPAVLAAFAGELHDAASALGVPRPEPFAVRERALANAEFVSFIESDGNTTARGLAARHSARSCHLFKLGAYWGYSAAVLALLPAEPASHALEIRHHATRAGLPAALFSPMTGSEGATRDTHAEVTRALVAQAGLAAPPEPAPRR